jgi:hypothetical protein
MLETRLLARAVQHLRGSTHTSTASAPISRRKSSYANADYDFHMQLSTLRALKRLGARRRYQISTELHVEQVPPISRFRAVRAWNAAASAALLRHSGEPMAARSLQYSLYSGFRTSLANQMDLNWGSPKLAVRPANGRFGRCGRVPA